MSSPQKGGGYKKIGSLITIFRKTNGRCFYCNKIGEHIDHFMPKQKWKEYEITEATGQSCDQLENLFMACASCNLSKANTEPCEWLWDMGRIPESKNVWFRYFRANHRVGLIDDELMVAVREGKIC